MIKQQNKTTNERNVLDGPVLVVDDDPLFCSLIEQILNKENIMAICYTKPEDAIEEIKRGL